MKRFYMSQREIAERFGLNFKTVYARLKEMEKVPCRYEPETIIRDGNLVLVYLPAFIDFEHNRHSLREKNMRKHVGPFEPERIIRGLAIGDWDVTKDMFANDSAQVDERELEEMVNKIITRRLYSLAKS